MKPLSVRKVHSDWRIRQLRAKWRDTTLLLRQFGLPLALFCIAIVGGGVLYYLLSITAGDPILNVAEAVYHILGLTFLQPAREFPSSWYLELFYFLMPLIGIGILAQGVAEFGVAFFNRRTRSKEWEMAVASTFSNHVVLVGLGHLGYRVVLQLHSLDQEVVVIELNPAADLVSSVQQLGIPVLQEDGVREVVLEAAGIRKARSIILCTQNDSLNLQIAVKARSLNPAIQVVVRIFDDDFAHALQDQFGFIALSATGMAAPAFAAAGAGVEMTRPITVDGHALSLARLTVAPSGQLPGLDVGRIEKEYDVSVVLLRNQNEPDLHPAPGRVLAGEDVLAVLGEPAAISVLVQANCTPTENETS